uniref:C2H2-type domain-containing protein n=2 Tax=Parascaris univalens TaxID=6257 RepID=A0A914ZG12_PARUN
MPLTRGGRSTISEDTESKPESKSRNIKSTLEIASRKQRTEKSSTKNESLLGTNETPVISNANEEGDKPTGSPSLPETPQRESRRIRRNTESALTSPSKNVQSARKREVSESAASEPSSDEASSQRNEVTNEAGREAAIKDHTGIAEVKSEGNAEKEEPVLRTSSRQRKPTARFFEMMEMEKRSKHQRQERTPTKATEKRRMTEDESEEIVVDVITDGDDGPQAKKSRTSASSSSKTKGNAGKEESRHAVMFSETVVRDMQRVAKEDEREVVEETVVVDELTPIEANLQPYRASRERGHLEEGDAERVVRGRIERQAAQGTAKPRTRNVVTMPPAVMPMENAVPATAPLLTTDRTNIRHIKRMKPEEREAREAAEKVAFLDRRHCTSVDRGSSSMMHAPRILDRRGDTAERSYRAPFYTPRSPRRSMALQEDEESVRSYGYRRTYREDIRAGRYLEGLERHEFIPQGQQIMLNEDGEEVIYEPIEVGEEEIIEEQIDDEDETLIFAEGDLDGEQEVQAEEPRTKISRSRQAGTVEAGRRRVTGAKGTDELEEATGAEIEDDEPPPHLDPEDGPAPEELLQMENLDRAPETEYIEGMGEVVRVQSPGGTQQFIQINAGQQIDGETFYVDENGMLIEEPSQRDLRAVEFNFLDNKNICCGLCGEIVPYDLLMSEHLPSQHPEVLGDGGSMDFEEIPYEVWLRDKLSSEKKHMENGFRSAAYDPLRMARSTRVLRRVSQVRVNPNEMSLAQLDSALRKKMVEKMGRKVPVTLVDKQHARCGICNAVVSLNRKFEVVHLVRHFNAWHPSAHRCAGTWKDRQPQPGMGKPLSTQDFAVIDTSLEVGDNLQCIWCGMFMDTDALAMHFSEVHPDEVEVPKCNLCLQELVINARLTEKYGEDFGISLPDEHHIRCAKFETIHTSESALDRLIERRLRRLQAGGESVDTYLSDENDDEDDRSFGAGPEAYLNSRMSFGRRSKPKRHFIMPALRQAAPIGSKYVEPVTECHWKCKLCKGDILAAVISAGAIRHFRTVHPEELEHMQYELCKARLERVSDGCMEFVHPQLIECLVCNMTYALHKPYNMCRAIRHLKSKHPDMMPEYAGMRDHEKGLKQRRQTRIDERIRSGGRNFDETVDENGFITDPETIAMLKAQYNVDFQRVQALEGSDGERVYVLMGEGEEIDAETAEQLAASLSSGEILAEGSQQTSEEVSQQKSLEHQDNEPSCSTEQFPAESEAQQDAAEREKSDEGEGQVTGEGGRRFDGTEFVAEPEYL